MIERIPARPCLLSINYHRLVTAGIEVYDPGVVSATAEAFRAHVRLLKERFAIVTLDEAVEIVTGRRRGRGASVLLTFDDGYIDCYTVAFPILRAERVPAAFFLTTSMVGSHRLPWWDQIAAAVNQATTAVLHVTYPWAADIRLDDGRPAAIHRLLHMYKSPLNREPSQFLEQVFEECGGRPVSSGARLFLDWDEAIDMQRQGMQFGSHTHTHPLLRNLTLAGQMHELSVSRAILESRLGGKVDTLAYPVGTATAFNTDTFSALRRCGYRAAFSFYGGLGEPGRSARFDIKRVSAEAEVSWPRFRLQCALAPHLHGYWF